MPPRVPLPPNDADPADEDGLPIPAYDALPALRIAYKALDTALRQHTGVLLIGPKWAGKTTGILRAIDLVHENEERLAAANENHRARRVLYVHSKHPRSSKEFVFFLLQKVVPGARDRDGVRRKSEDTMVQELVNALLHKRYGIVVCDEAEYLTNAAIDTMRKIVSQSFVDDKRRTQTVGTTEVLRPAGVGVVLVGTETVRTLVHQNPDARFRLGIEHEVPTINANQVHAAYLHVFPGFGAHIAQIGINAWIEYCRLTVALGRPMVIGKVVQHCRLYFEMMVEASRGTESELRTREGTPFNDVLFIKALRRCDGPKPPPLGGGTAK